MMKLKLIPTVLLMIAIASTALSQETLAPIVDAARQATPEPIPMPGLSNSPGPVGNPGSMLQQPPSIIAPHPAPVIPGNVPAPVISGSTPAPIVSGSVLPGQPAPVIGGSAAPVIQPAPVMSTDGSLQIPTISPHYGDISMGCDAGGCDSFGASGCDPGGCSSCGGGIGSCLGSCASRFWGDIEYMLWWTEGTYMPPLITTAAPNTPATSAGLTNQLSTRSLFGGGDVDRETSEGLRLQFGMWFDPNETIGLEARYFNISDDLNYSESSTGIPILARPFRNVALGQSDALLVAYPGVSRGSAYVEDDLEIDVYDLAFRRRLFCGCRHRVDALLGFRHASFDNTLRVGHRLVSTDPAGRFAVGTRLDSFDEFEAENRFNGGILGLRSDHCWGRFITLNSALRIALGNMQQEIRATGQTVVTLPQNGPSATSNVGLLAQDSNRTPFEQNSFAVIPELNLGATLKLKKHLGVNVGYNVIYFSDVLLPGNSIDLNIDTTQAVARPVHVAGSEGFWAHGFNFGVNFEF